MPSANMASESSMRMTFDFVFLESLAPIWAPMAAPMEMQMAGIQMMWSSMKWLTTPKAEEQASTKWLVAVATWTGKPSK